MNARWSLSALGFALAACGPNYRYVYDGEAAFERCYALDYDQDATPSTRQQCWAAWLQSYSYGAGLDRVEYARMRSTPQGAAAASPDGAAASAPGAPPAPPPASARPSAPEIDARMPPPSVRSAPLDGGADPWGRAQISGGGNPVGAPPPTAAPAAPEAEPPGAACSTDCHEAWHGCGRRCAGNDAACVARCDDAYRECMRGCF